ncbi:MAG: hypothetical protein ACOCV2_11585 [Persicimonas sp.]
MKIIEEGSRVRALVQIVEDGGDPDPEAEPLEEGWVHAEPGDEGVVVDIDQAVSLEEGVEDTAAMNVRFDRTDTVCMVLPPEIEIVEDD